jgi:D-3-phosphoglycerate dehydrogenase / 2-oxoglutarate reductase
MTSPMALMGAVPRIQGLDMNLASVIRECGCTLTDLGPECRRDSPELKRRLAQADILIPGNLLQVDQDLLAVAPGLKLIAKPGAGVDNIDLDAATAAGVVVCHTPGVNAMSVADHTWAMILNLARRINQSDREVRQGKWIKTAGLELWGKTLGLIGLGAIGRAVARRATGFDLRILAFDPYCAEDGNDESGITPVKLDELLAASDIISIHCPLTPETRRLIGAGELAAMKPTAILINTARGHIVDEGALAQALRLGKIAGAGLDAFAGEPLRDSPLMELDNVVLTPHTAWLSREALERTALNLAANVKAWLRRHVPPHVANPRVLESPACQELIF